ncbi:ABC transporter permease [Gemelliphila palaticanis]|uniref:ABC transporter permease n=1 Tax=Gemelliphila palaticanis TaxID=81950 RepID=A0ABX2SXI1_9BACL|nr:ABC transporter permease [Gemella palaticanis]MBF0714930.1 ABC transporter permease [Gemella palaticanis]NYS46860.1 ABC transporter permease [Gemella palaticanis]
MEFLISSIAQGFLWSILSLGLFISFRVLNIADMTTEGSFTLGGAIAVTFIVSDFNPFLTLVFAFFAGAISGLFTSLLINYCKIPSLLAGILTMTGLLSINLRIMGKPNISLLNNKSVFSIFENINLPKNYDVVFLGLLMLFIIISLIVTFFKTEVGQDIIATGDNEDMAKSFGISTKLMISFGLMISNGLIALSGGILVQYQGFSDINSGIGTIVIALAAIIIGEVLFKDVSFTLRLICIVIGSIVYRILLLFVIQFNIASPNDFKLISALLIIVFLSLPTINKSIRNRGV